MINFPTLHFKKLDWTLVISSILLVCFGLISLYSSSLGKDTLLNFQKQIIFFVIGLFLMFFFSLLDWRTFSQSSNLILILYFACCFLLAGLFWFAPEIRGVKAWYKLGPVSLDPIEPSKIVLIILLAKFFSTRHVEMYRIRHIILSGIYVFIPIFLISLQPDMGSVLILIALWIGVLIVSGIKIRHFLMLVFFFLLILMLTWSTVLKEYQKERIISFLLPQLELLGAGWSQAQAQIAIGAGGLFGQGFGSGSQTQLGFLPEPQTDFIFAAIAEEFGLLGVTVLLFLFSILIWRMIKIAIGVQGNFPRLFATGLAFVLVSQTFIHIGMNLGILPIIGISLPLISYGGSSLIAVFVGLGFLQSIKSH
jgi:rod shape determining protein RodA